MSTTTCECKPYRERSYLKSPADLSDKMELTQKLVEAGLFILTGDFDENANAYKKEYTCATCNRNYVLEYESNHNTGSFGPKSNMKSDYLIRLDYWCQKNNIKELYRGGSIYDDSKPGEWVYFDCYFDEQKIIARFNLPATVKYYEYNGLAAGQESGFVDELTNDAVLGNHPYYGKKGNKRKLG